MIREFIHVRGRTIIRQLSINVFSIYLFGYIIGQTVYTITNYQAHESFRVMDMDNLILGFKLLTLAAAGLAIHLIWTEVSEFRKGAIEDSHKKSQ